ncbi:MAG: hypothetical protein II210_06975 [Rikenellaceae bacterium]|nr:hypothetical protein [Rikenellaceae bacterium]
MELLRAGVRREVRFTIHNSKSKIQDSKFKLGDKPCPVGRGFFFVATYVHHQRHAPSGLGRSPKVSPEGVTISSEIVNIHKGNALGGTIKNQNPPFVVGRVFYIG